MAPHNAVPPARQCRRTGPARRQPPRPGLRRTALTGAGLPSPGPYPPSARGGTPNGFPGAILHGPLPDLPPAVFGMPQSAQVGTPPLGGTPEFIPRPDTGLSRGCGVLPVTYPLSLPRPVRKSSLPPLPSTTGILPSVAAIYNRTTSTTIPPQAKAERAGCCCSAKLR